MYDPAGKLKIASDEELNNTTKYYLDENGKRVACTVIQAGPCVVTQVKTESNDGYSAVQLAYGDKKEKHTNSALSKSYSSTISKSYICFSLIANSPNPYVCQ